MHLKQSPMEKRLNELEIKERIETTQTTAQKKNRLGYLEESWITEYTCCHSVSCEKLSDRADVKNMQYTMDQLYSNVNAYERQKCPNG